MRSSRGPNISLLRRVRPAGPASTLLGRDLERRCATAAGTKVDGDSEVTSGGPYRPLYSSSYLEEELWLSLDDALVEVYRDPRLAWDIAFRIAMDAADFPDVLLAAEQLMSELLADGLD